MPDREESPVKKRQRAMNQQARELGMPVPFPKIVKKEKSDDGSKPMAPKDVKQGFRKR